MNFIRLVLSSLRFHARSHLGALVSAAIGSAVLIGALIVGDSIRASLRNMALARIGKADYALVGNDRFFRAQLADDLRTLGDVAPVLQVAGIVATSDNSARANQVQVLGVDDRFWKLANKVPQKASTEGIVLNERLAHHLKVKPGQTVVLRIHKPSLLSRESPISPQEDSSAVIRMDVSGVADDDAFGRFSLQANQIPPFNAFVPISMLQKRLELEGKANLLLARLSDQAKDPTASLSAAWLLADAQLELVSATNQPGIELRSERVFLEEGVVSAATNVAPDHTGVLTYFVNELRLGERSTPYSIITAAESPIIPHGMQSDEILLGEWLTEDLAAKPGDQIALSYFLPSATQQLIEKTNVFKVRGIVPLKGIYSDRSLMPEFPGISKAEKTENWDAGFAIDMNRIRPKDEKYWEQFRGTPKAFITLAAGQQMWSNQFGKITAIRFPNVSDPSQIASKLQSRLTPRSLGLAFQPIRKEALAASAPAQDFGQLFMGFSFFLIVAALILMALLFQFGIEQRVQETGTLLALGFRPRQVRNLLLWEGTGLALLGGIVGAGGGILYAWLLLRGLTTIWRNAVGTSALHFHLTSLAICIDLFASTFICAITILLVVRKQANLPARVLLNSDAETLQSGAGKRSRRFAGWISIISLTGAVALVTSALVKEQAGNAGVFFGAGVLLLVAGLSATALWLRWLGNAARALRSNMGALGIRNASRRRKRSLATVTLLASGTFLIVAIGAFRLETSDALQQRSSGTGGFSLIGEAAFPVIKSLDAPAGRAFFGLEESDLAGVNIVSLRVRDGDDASCLNLNLAQRPRLLGVDPQALASRKSFTFVKTIGGETISNPWNLLTNPTTDEIPAIGDAASIKYAMGKSVGDLIDYTDQRGNKFKIRIVGSVANSILQGSLLIDEKAFVEKFPSEAGYRMFLIDAPSKTRSAILQTFARALRDVGLELTAADERLAAFNAVQNTYLNTFQILGGLGLLLGSAGLGIVVLRNVFERRNEFATLQALGFRKKMLRQLVLREHILLLWLGLGIGITGALIAVVPSLVFRGSELPFLFLSFLLGAILFCGLLSTWVATNFSLRGELLKALRNE